MIVDTHVHLTDDKYNNILDSVIKDSVEYGCNTFFTMGCDYKSSLEAVNVARTLNGKMINNTTINCYAFVGIYPEEVMKDETSDDVNKLVWVEKLYNNNKDVVKGIGEIGIDLYWDKSKKEEQIAFFKKQLDIALKLNLPVSIHAREATQVVYDILKEYYINKKKIKGVLHCYSGSVEMAREFVKLGLKIGIGGVLTFKNAKLVDVVKELDLSCMVTETDGPYLAPAPFRGEINKSGYIKFIINKMAEIKEMDYNIVESILEKNAKEIFNI